MDNLHFTHLIKYLFCKNFFILKPLFVQVSDIFVYLSNRRGPGTRPVLPDLPLTAVLCGEHQGVPIPAWGKGGSWVKQCRPSLAGLPSPSSQPPWYMDSVAKWVLPIPAEGEISALERTYETSWRRNSVGSEEMWRISEASFSLVFFMPTAHRPGLPCLSWASIGPNDQSCRPPQAALVLKIITPPAETPCAPVTQSILVARANNLRVSACRVLPMQFTVELKRCLSYQIFLNNHLNQK